MPNIFRILICGLVGLGLAIGVLAPAPAAEAIEVKGATSPGIVMPQPKAPPKDDRNLSASAKADIAAASRINRYAIGKKRRWLNYRKANTYDNGRTKLRRKFAAGWTFMGKPITNISKAERKMVNVYVAQMKKRGSSQRAKLLAAKSNLCKGSTRTVTLRGGAVWAYDFYFDSCDTTKIIAALNIIGGVAGVLAVLAVAGGYTAAYAVYATVVGALAVIGGQVVTLFRDLSSEEAVVVRDNFHLVTVRSQ